MAAGEFSTVQAVQMATRNHGMPLEALRYPVTPTGLHYLLIHYDIPSVDPGTWRLAVDGEVERSFSLTLDEIRQGETVHVHATMECAGNGRARLDPMPASQPWLLEAVGTSLWGGIRLADVLERAGLRERAVEVLFTGLDRGVEGGVEQEYQRSLPVAEAMRDDVLLAFEMNGADLLPQHGYPLRLLVPGWYGMTSVKWLSRITVIDHRFDGYQQDHSYRLRLDENDPGTPLDRMLPRSLMVPPGIPEFLTRARLATEGRHVLTGRAWSGHAPIARVEVSLDGGRSWAPAATARELESPWAWCAWEYVWDAVPGEYTLCCRAADEGGNEQPVEPIWNVGGYANNAVQQVPVTVRPAG